MKKIRVKQLRSSGVAIDEQLTTNQVEYLARLSAASDDVSLGFASASVTKAYEDSVSSLRTNTGLNITVTGYQYFRFADASAEFVSSHNWGDNIGLSREQAADVTNNELGTVFAENNDINFFNEFENFSGITSIPSGAFQNCKKLKTIKFPLSALNIASYAFSGDSSLVNVANMSSISTVGVGAFMNCTSLLNLGNFLPTNVSTSSFENCSSLSHFDFSRIQFLNSNSTFQGCSKLNNIDLSGLQNCSGATVFRNCTSLSGRINLSNVSNSIGLAAFSGCSKITDVSIGSGVTEIGNGCFSADSSLAHVSLSDASCTIGNGCFSGDRSLTEVSGISNVVSLGENCFKDCISLPYLRFIYNRLVELGSVNAFDNTTCKFYVGDGSYPYRDNQVLATYMNDSKWRTFRDRFDIWTNMVVNLPSLYHKVNWIQSDGESIIDSGLSFSNNSKMTADISFVFDSSIGLSVFGSEESGFKADGTGIYFSFSNEDASVFQGDAFTDTEMLLKVDIPARKLYKNDVEVYSSDTGTGKGGNITFFGKGGAAYTGKSWYVEVYSGDNLAAVFIPCYRTSDLSVGFYDIIRKTFYGHKTYVCEGVNRGLVCENDDVLMTETGHQYFTVDLSHNDTKISQVDTDTTFHGFYSVGSKNGTTQKMDLTFIDVLKNACQIDNFSDVSSYTTGTLTKYNNLIYRFTTNHSAGAWDFNDVEQTTAMNEVMSKHTVNKKEHIYIKLKSDDGLANVANVTVRLVYPDGTPTETQVTTAQGTCEFYPYLDKAYYIQASNQEGYETPSSALYFGNGETKYIYPKYIKVHNEPLHTVKVNVSASSGTPTGFNDVSVFSFLSDKTFEQHRITDASTTFSIREGLTCKIMCTPLTGYTTPDPSTFVVSSDVTINQTYTQN